MDNSPQNLTGHVRISDNLFITINRSRKLFTSPVNNYFHFLVLLLNFEKSPHTMTHIEFRAYNDQPCRFRLKSGKEVFGVIWEKPQPGNTSYYFASLSERFNRSMRNSSI